MDLHEALQQPEPPRPKTPAVRSLRRLESEHARQLANFLDKQLEPPALAAWCQGVRTALQLREKLDHEKRLEAIEERLALSPPKKKRTR